MKNAKLWKRILHEGVFDHGEAKLRAVTHDIITAPIVVDTRPHCEEDVIGRHVLYKEMKPLAVPFDRFWIEQPSSSNGIELLAGMYFRGKFTKKGWEGSVAGFQTDASTPVAFVGVARVEIEGGAIVNNPIDRIGQVAHLPQEFCEWATDCWVTTFAASLDTLLMLGCKNVDLSPREFDEPKQARIAAKRHGGKPDDYRYHVLTVRPAGSKPGTPGQDIGIMPRHVCRGHFAEYGPEFNKGLLFGKYAGRFYVPPHLKGDKKNGVVEKDYQIGTP
jgi:hypothetical protein